jgi:hypothetical protein
LYGRIPAIHGVRPGEVPGLNGAGHGPVVTRPRRAEHRGVRLGKMIQQFLRSRGEHDLDVGSALLSDAVVRSPDALCRRNNLPCHEIAIDGLQSGCLWTHGRAPAGDLVEVGTGCAVRLYEVGDDVVNERMTIVGVCTDDDFIQLLRARLRRIVGRPGGAAAKGERNDCGIECLISGPTSRPRRPAPFPVNAG